MKQVIFGLFLTSESFPDILLGIMEENTFLSKKEAELENICFWALPTDISSRMFMGDTIHSHFDISAMKCIIESDNGIATVQFMELNVIN